MGCLYFNLTESMTWLESMQSCQLGHENAAAVEIISAEVEVYQSQTFPTCISETLQQNNYLTSLLVFLAGEVTEEKIILI